MPKYREQNESMRSDYGSAMIEPGIVGWSWKGTKGERLPYQGETVYEHVDELSEPLYPEALIALNKLRAASAATKAREADKVLKGEKGDTIRSIRVEAMVEKGLTKEEAIEILLMKVPKE